MHVLRTRRHRGTTILEVVIASALMLTLSVMVMSAMIYYMRALSVLRARADLAEQSRNVQRELVYSAASATSLAVGDSGNRLTFTFPTGSDLGTTRVIQYTDGDNNNNTIGDNMLRDTTDATNPIIIANQIARIINPATGNPIPVFVRPAAGTQVEISLRFGDTINQPDSASDAFTGPGFQTYAMRTGIVARN